MCAHQKQVFFRACPRPAKRRTPLAGFLFADSLGWQSKPRMKRCSANGFYPLNTERPETEQRVKERGRVGQKHSLLNVDGKPSVAN
jgi:hypothetical protein